MEFHVLGPVEALKDGVTVRLGGPKQRTVLALLVLEAGRTVSADRLIDLLWGEEPTPGARSTLQTYISNLRGEIGELLIREGGGYRLDVEREQVDACRFEDEVTHARDRKDSKPLEAAQRFRDALALWRGRPYADISGSVVLDQEARRLEEMRLAAIEDRLEAEVTLGNHAEVVGELEVLTTEHPFRERFQALHMLSLYRSGRQAEALQAYQKTRVYLADELGIDPAPSLKELEGKILRQDPSLVLETQPRVETLVFLLADIEDSTVLWELHPRDMGPAAAQYDRIIAEAVEAAGGRVVKRVGDGLDAVFSDVGSAVAAAGEAQRALVRTEWGPTGPLKARMAMDVGDVEARGTDYFGPTLNRCGRILAAGHGGQVLLSADAHAALSSSEAGWEIRALGEFRFKGLGRPQQVFQLLVEGLPSEFPPLRIDRLPPPLRTSFERTVRGYELREQVGGGEFGVVYRAYQPSVGREVAVKVIRSEFVNKPAFVRRFEAEAQTVAHLEHPHIVALYDYWRDPEGAYLVMRWLRGGALRDALDRGPWNLEPASLLLQQIGSALAYAHRQGIVHRDLKPANVLLDEEGNAYLSDFGVASRLVDASEAGRPITSSPAYVAPEELRGEPLRPASDIFALGLLTFELLTGRPPPMDRSLPALTELRPDLPEGIGPVIARATADDPAARFASVDEFLRALLGALGEAPSPEEPAFKSTRNPYKGLHAFSELDAHDFFGREAMTEELLHAVKEHRLVAVVGPSGIGKSSVVRAGLIPALRAGALSGSREWVITDMFPGSYPFEELEAALLRVAVERPEGLTEDLARDERGILRVTKRILPPGSQALLVVDQFEELFTLTSDEETRRLFLDALAALVTDGRSRMQVVVTMRADFFDRPLRYPSFGELLREGIVALTAPSETDLTEAITRPGDGVGVRFEPGLVSRIISDVNDQPGALPLLQYALTELFASRTSDLLTIHGYQASGRVLGALGRRAEDLYQGLDTQGQEAARQLFLRLVAVNEAGEDARRRLRRQELHGLGVEPAAMDEVLRRFGEYRLLTFDRDPLTRGPTVEVAHEALLSEWERLRTWIDERREDLLLHRRLVQAVAEWDESGRQPSYLLREARLEHSEVWAAETDLALTADERKLLQESRREEDERGRRVARRRKGILTGFGIAAAVSLLLAGLAYLNLHQANRQRDAARQQAIVADARRLATQALGEEQLDRSLLLALVGVTLHDSDETESALLASLQRSPEAIGVMRGAGHFPGLAITPDGRTIVAGNDRGVVYGFDAASGRRIGDPIHLSGTILDVATLAVSPDGRTLAAAVFGAGNGEEWALELLDLRTKAMIFQHIVESASHLDSVAFSPDGRTVAVTEAESAGGDIDSLSKKSVLLFDSMTGARRGQLVFPRRDLHPWSPGLSFSPDGRNLVTSTFDTSTVIWDIRSKTEERRFDIGGPLALSPDGHTAAVGGANGSLALLDLETGNRVDLQGNQEAVPRRGVSGLRFSPDGSLLVTGNEDGTVQLWDVRSGEPPTTLKGHAAKVWDVVFSPDGRTVYSSSQDGSIIAWDIAGDRRLGRPFVWDSTLESNAVFAVSPAGTLLAAAKEDGAVVLLDLKSLSRVGELPPAHGGPTFALAFSPDGRTLVSTGQDGTVALWDVEKRALLGHPWQAHRGSGWAAAFSPNGETFATGFEAPVPAGDGTVDTTIVLWDVQTHARRREFRRHGSIWMVDFNSDGALLSATGSTGAAVWDVATGRRVLAAEISDAAGSDFSPDGRLVAIGDFQGTLSFWDLKTSKRLTQGLTGLEGVGSVAFSPDGSRLVTGSANGEVVIRDVRSLQAIGAAFRPPEREPCWGVFTADGSHLLTVCIGSGASWAIDPAAWKAHACRLVGRSLSPEEWKQLLPNQPYQAVCG